VSTTPLEDLAVVAGVEPTVIDSNAKRRDVQNALRWNDASPYSTFNRAQPACL
jgi:L-arabinose isomerase